MTYQGNNARQALASKLDERAWALTGETDRLDARCIEACQARLVGRVVRAGLRLGLIDEHVDEGELGEVAYIEPGEIYGCPGCVAVSVHIASGSTRVWMYEHLEQIELPHAVDALAPCVEVAI